MLLKLTINLLSDPPKTKSCTATSEGGVVEGKCITDAKCKNSGGTPKGSCGFLEKCCVCKSETVKQSEQQLINFISQTTIVVTGLLHLKYLISREKSQKQMIFLRAHTLFILRTPTSAK